MAIRNVINPYPELSVTITTRTDELSAALTEALTRALDTAADAIVADAKERAPVLTGFMRDSTLAEPTADPLTVMIRAEAPYSGWVDSGTARQQAKPWFTPAIDQGRLTLAEAVEKAVRDVTRG